MPQKGCQSIQNEIKAHDDYYFTQEIEEDQVFRRVYEQLNWFQWENVQTHWHQQYLDFEHSMLETRAELQQLRRRGLGLQRVQNYQNPMITYQSESNLEQENQLDEIVPEKDQYIQSLIFTYWVREDFENKITLSRWHSEELKRIRILSDFETRTLNHLV